MPNMVDAYDADMLAKSKMNRWQADFEAKWSEPQTVLLQAEWQKLPEQAKAILRTQLDPEILRIVEGNDGNS